jgi:hypothetical protein
MISSRFLKDMQRPFFILGQEDGSFITYGNELEEFMIFLY